MTPEERSRNAQHAAIKRWAKEDPYEGTKAARRGFLARFERQVDPDNLLDPAERHKRAQAAMKRHMRAIRSNRTMKELARKAEASEANDAA